MATSHPSFPRFQRLKPWGRWLGRFGLVTLSTALTVSLVLSSCRESPPVDEDMMSMPPDMAKATDDGPCDATTVIEQCKTLPPAPMGQRCTVTPDTSGSKRILLRANVLLPDKILRGGEVVVDENGKIACAACDCSAMAGAASVVECPSGVLSPGLINTHDHITFTKAAPGTSPTNRYDHRHEWRIGVMGDPNKPKINVPGGANAQAVQWGELRQLMAGTTSLVGSGSANGVLRNLDTGAQEGLKEVPVDFDTFPLGDSKGERLTQGCGYPSVRSADSLFALDAVEPHIAEGINAEAHNEFLCLSSSMNGGQDLMSNKTALIHGIALTAQDAQLVAQRGVGIIWSPRSNVSLYGHTAQIPMLDRAGALVALGTDWSASGSINLLRELACAADLNKNQWGGYFNHGALWRMVTLNAAMATATAETLGQIKTGYVADLAIYDNAIPGRCEYSAVVRAEVSNVTLVLRGGLPMYGDGAVMEALGAGSANKCENLDVCGTDKRLCVERETGRKLTTLENDAKKPIYRLFACGVPTDEPSCVPFRKGEFDGMSTADDPDGDGRRGMDDNCPTVFNPIRPMDEGKQPDSDGDGLGDACDPCPLDKDAMTCMRADPSDGDADGVPDVRDNCLAVKNTDQLDTDMDGQGDACDLCPMTSNPGFGPCPFTVQQMRDPAQKSRPPIGAGVIVKDLLVVGIRDKASYGFHARDKNPVGSQDYSGIIVFTGGTMPPTAADKTPIAVGMVVRVSGSFDVFNNQEQIVAKPADITITETGVAVTPLDIKTSALTGGTESGEKLESLLVRVQNVTMRRTVAAMDDDLYVTDDAAEMCADMTPPCTRIGDFLLDNGKFDMNPAFMMGGTFKSAVGVVSGFRNFYSLEPRNAMDLTP